MQRCDCCIYAMLKRNSVRYIGKEPNTLYSGTGSSYEKSTHKIMNYCNIKKCDIANGTGVRVTLFVSGCTNHCKGCFQPETWDFDYGEPFTEETEKIIFAELDKSYIKGLTLLGGDPFEPANQEALLPFLKKVRAAYPDKNIWAFTGFLYDEELLKDGAYPRCAETDEMLGLIDMLVDGRFVEGLKDITLRFRGSSNQRIIDLDKTRSDGRIVLWSGMNNRD